jgi:hypothetical protein
MLFSVELTTNFMRFAKRSPQVTFRGIYPALVKNWLNQFVSVFVLLQEFMMKFCLYYHFDDFFV